MNCTQFVTPKTATMNLLPALLLSASCTMGTGSFPGLKSGRGVTLTPRHLLVSWSFKSRAIPLLPLRAVRPVQSLSACTRGALYLFLYHDKHKNSYMFRHRSDIFRESCQVTYRPHWNAENIVKILKYLKFSSTQL